jgi:hypothetical protein
MSTTQTRPVAVEPPVVAPERTPRLSVPARTGLGLGLVAIGLVLAVVTSVDPYLTLALGAGLLVIGLTVRQPLALPILGMPALLLVNRVGGALSVSDFVLFAAFWPALLFCRRPLSRPMRHVLWASAIYQASVLFTVIANPYLANLVEWFHSWLLVAGALIVGWAIGAAGQARLALGLYLGGSVVVAVVALGQFVINLSHGDTGPVYLGELFVLFLAGILVAQSRQALIGLALAVAVVALRPDPHRHRSKVVLLAVAAGALVVGTLVQDQLESGDQYNSAYQRLVWFQQSLNIWEEYPWFGAGLRWWYTDRFAEKFQPPNAEFEMLSSGGMVGLIGFLLMFLIILVVLWRLDPRFGTLAFVTVMMRFVQGQFDLFWVAAQVSIPFVIAGICLGAQAHAARTEEDRRAIAAASGEPEPVPTRRELRRLRLPRGRRGAPLPLPVGHKEHP